MGKQRKILFVTGMLVLTLLGNLMYQDKRIKSKEKLFLKDSRRLEVLVEELGCLEKNKDLLNKIIIEEEYGMREEVLESPTKAGFYTGIFYIIGALTPLISYYLLLPITTAIMLSPTVMMFTLTGLQ